MFGSITRRRIWRPELRFLAGAVLAATLIAPIANRDSASIAEAASYTRSESCAGLSFYPIDSRDGYSSQGTERYLAYTDGGNAYFLCDPGLPNGAVVTKVQFTVRDNDDFKDISNCALVRSGLTPATAATAQVLAGPMGTSATPGVVRLTDTSIAFATVNNASYAYYLQCRIDGNVLGIHGANVTYTITAAKG